MRQEEKMCGLTPAQIRGLAVSFIFCAYALGVSLVWWDVVHAFHL